MIQIIDQDGDVIELVTSCSSGDIRVITTIFRRDDDLVLQGLHIDGPGPGRHGLATLRRLARELGRLHGANRVIIEGGRRTTGAAAGHMPRPIVIAVGEGEP